MKTILTFQVTQIHKHYFIIVASQLIDCCHAGNFSFPVLILKYLNLESWRILMRIAKFITKNC